MRMCSNQEERKLGGIGRLISERLNKNSCNEKYPTKQAGLLQWRRLLCPVFASRDDVLHEAAKPERQSRKPTVVVRVPLLCSFLHLRERPPIHSPARLWSHETSLFPPSFFTRAPCTIPPVGIQQARRTQKGKLAVEAWKTASAAEYG